VAHSLSLAHTAHDCLSSICLGKGDIILNSLGMLVETCHCPESSYLYMV
jgi:hypothetical protein